MSSDSYDKFSGAQAISSDAFYGTGPAQPARGGGGGGGEEVRNSPSGISIIVLKNASAHRC